VSWPARVGGVQAERARSEAVPPSRARLECGWRGIVVIESCYGLLHAGCTMVLPRGIPR
jgi:hypothetical protein